MSAFCTSSESSLIRFLLQDILIIPDIQSLKCSASTVTVSPTSVRSSVLKNYGSQTTLTADGKSGDESLDEVVSVMMTPKTGNRLHVPRDVLRTQVRDLAPHRAAGQKNQTALVQQGLSYWWRTEALAFVHVARRTASFCLPTLTA